MNNNNSNNNDSLKKSHSKFSNFKLTLLCIIATLAISALWAVLGFKDSLTTTWFYTLIGITGGISLISILLFNAFKR
jgi:predicted permease